MLHARLWFLALILLAITLVLLAWRCRYAWRLAPPQRPRRPRRLHPQHARRMSPLPPGCHTAPGPAIAHHPPLARGQESAWGTAPHPHRGLCLPAARLPVLRSHRRADARLGRRRPSGAHRSDPAVPLPASGAKVSARWGTALSHLKTPPARIGEVLSALAEGMDVSAAVRVFGHGETTITRWRDRAAQHAERMHRHFLHGLHCPHLQLDEIRTRLRARERVTWLWLALDPRTKLIPALALGPRTQHTAHTLVHTLRTTLAPGCTPVITTDGLCLYFYAITAHFGHWTAAGHRRRWVVNPALLYGQLHKRYQRRRLARITYQMHSGTRPTLRATLLRHVAHRVGGGAQAGTRPTLRATLLRLGWNGKLQTAFVERVNLTARHGRRRAHAAAPGLPPRPVPLASSRQSANGGAAYYHFIRPHLGLRQSGHCPHPGGGSPASPPTAGPPPSSWATRVPARASGPAWAPQRRPCRPTRRSHRLPGAGLPAPERLTAPDRRPEGGAGIVTFVCLEHLRWPMPSRASSWHIRRPM